jgi:hydrogenase expression/formation protein HypD
MRFVDEYRNPAACLEIANEIRRTATRNRTIMEVCGGQTHGLLRHGIDQQLEGAVTLIHGPGCPVCVTPVEDIDFAIELACLPGTVLVSFGDMLRVPGSSESLLQARARGGNVRSVYSPLDAVELARQSPERQVVFFAVGFETTAPATALAVRQAHALGLSNFSLIVAHVRVLPAMSAVMGLEPCVIEGFLAAGHVCTVDGFESYHQFTSRHRVPVAVTGFEPLDLLAGILECVRLIEGRKAMVVNAYQRSARERGNPGARGIVDEIYEVCDRRWRGLGGISGGGLKLRPRWSAYDASLRFARRDVPCVVQTRCRSGEVLTGLLKPTECECFGRECTPDSPLGAPMVSSEGACAAYYQHAARIHESQRFNTRKTN